MWEFLDWLSYWKLKSSEMWRCLIVWVLSKVSKALQSCETSGITRPIHSAPSKRLESSAKVQSEAHIWLGKSVPWNWIVRTATVLAWIWIVRTATVLAWNWIVRMATVLTPHVSSFPLWLRFRKVKVSLLSTQCSQFLKQHYFLEGPQASPICPSGKSNRLQSITRIILVYKHLVRTAQ